VDNSRTNGAAVDNLGTTWGPRRPLAWITAAATIGAAVGATLFSQDGDRAGALLLWLVAIVFAGATAYLTMLNPRLRADAGGVSVRTIKGSRQVPWSKLDAKVQLTRRFGRDTKTLELEIGDDGSDLVVLGWLELGDDPDEVLAELNRLRAR
jgi:Bacterial PH domain